MEATNPFWPCLRRQVDFWFDAEFPGEPCSPCPPNSKKQAVLRATNHWNKLGQQLQLVGHPEEEVAVSSWEGYCEDYDGDGDDAVWLDNGDPIGVIFWDQMPSTVESSHLAITKTCRRRFPGQSVWELWSFKHLYNPDKRWHSGRGRDVPRRSIDLQSVAGHEFGHATGWGPHYDYHPTAPQELSGNEHCERNNPDRWTMCALIHYGESWSRTVEKHDKHTFGNAYPP